MRLSLSQLSYLQTSLVSSTPIRPDSRNLRQFRPISFSCSTLPGCLGSVHLTWGPVIMIVGIKGEVVPGSPSIEHHMEVLRERDDDPLTTSLAQCLAGLLQMDAKSGIDSADLRVTKGYSWNLFVDVILLSHDESNPTPALSLAIRLALLNTRLPRTNSAEPVEGDAIGSFEVDDDYENAVPIPSAAQLPLYTMVNYIGSHVLFDAAPEEEQILTGRYMIGVLETGQINICQTVGNTKSPQDVQGREDRRGLTASELQRGLKEGVDITMTLFSKLRACVENPEELYTIL